MIDEDCSNQWKAKLASISEEQNFLLKNRFLLDKTVMNYARKDKMPIDVMKVKDVLRNQHIIRNQINEDIVTYKQFMEHTNLEEGVLTYINEAAGGDLRDLLKDIGVNTHTIQYTSVTDVIKARDEAMVTDSNLKQQNLYNSRITLIDMTDYEDDFGSIREVDDIPIMSAGYLQTLKREKLPMTHTIREFVRDETISTRGTSKTYRDILAERAAAAEAEPEEDEDEEEEE